MAKRKLNKRQQWRIEKIQKERTDRASRKESDITEQLTGNDLGPEQQGMIIAHFGTQVEVESLDNLNEDGVGETRRCHMRANLGSLVTGDKVVFRMDKDEIGVVVAILPRVSELSRPNPYNEIKPVAANIDFIVLVVACEPVVHPNLIDRYLVAAETLNIKPALLFNKSDLINDENRDAINTLCESYRSLGYEVLQTSAFELEQCESTLLDWLRSYTSIFVGQSGVGKSSLIGSILGDKSIRIGPLSELSRKGMHTTTTAKLFHIPGGGKIVDSPGIREFGLWHITEQELIEGFIELRPFIGYCRFRDCRHNSEPKCAILSAQEEGKISQTRMDSYRRIRETLDDKETYL